MALHEVRINRDLPLTSEPQTGHNRWHPDLRPVITCEPGDEVTLQTRDALDGQVSADSELEDVMAVDLNVVHPLTGPVRIEGAEPGDMLVVDVLEVEAPDFGFTVQIPGFGFLRDYFPDPFLVKWEISDGWATSEQIPGVRIPGSPFMGTFGVAPSRALMTEINEREQRLSAQGGVVLLPEATGAIPGDAEIASEALRTIPPRENAGNVDIKQTGGGAKLFIPVWTDGALFSVGDAHFAQGDSESCGTAIEIAGTGRFRFGLEKGAAAEQGVRSLAFSRIDYHVAPEYATPKAFYATTGICVGDDGENTSEDVTTAARNATRAMIAYLTAERGYTPQQAYALCSVAVDLKISELPDVPNALVSAFLPLAIFDEN